MKITFNKSAREFVISAFNLIADKDGYIIDSESRYVLSKEYLPVHLNDLGGIEQSLDGNLVLLLNNN